MPAADPFAPPTPDELAMFAPPTPEELGQSGRPNRAMMDADSMQAYRGNTQAWSQLPWYAKVGIAPDQMTEEGLEARNAAYAASGDALMTMVTGAVTEPLAWMGEAANRYIPGVSLLLGGQTPQQTRESMRATGTWRPRTEGGQQFLQSVGESGPMRLLGAGAEKLRAGKEWGASHLGPLGSLPFDMAEGALMLGRAPTAPFEGAVEAARGAQAAGRESALLRGGPTLQPVREAPVPTAAQNQQNQIAKFGSLEPAYTRTPVADLANRGYTVVPRDVQSAAGVEQAKQVTGGTAARLGPDVAETRVPIRNAKNATLRGTDDIAGIRRTEVGAVDPASIAEALDAESVPYQQIRRDLPTPPTNTLAGKLRAVWQARGASLKGDPVAESRLAPLMDENTPPLPADEVLDRWREVNGYAAGLRRAVNEGDPGAGIKSADLRAISDALLDELDTRAQSMGRPDIIPALKAARVKIARIHELRDALDPHGFVQGLELAKSADRGTSLSGGLAEVASDARRAKRSFGAVDDAVDAEGNFTYHSGARPRNFLGNAIGRLFGDKLAERRIELLNDELRRGSSAIDYPAPQGRPPAPLLSPRSPPQNDMFGGGLDTPPTGLAPAAGAVGASPTPTIGGRPTGSFSDFMGELAADPQAPQFPMFDFNPHGQGGSVFGDQGITAKVKGFPITEPQFGLLDEPPKGFAQPDINAPSAPAPRGDLQMDGLFADEIGVVPKSRGWEPPAPPEPTEGFAGILGDTPRKAGKQAKPQGPAVPPGEPPPQPRFGPEDEFPGAAPPVAPQGPAPGGAGGAGATFSSAPGGPLTLERALAAAGEDPGAISSVLRSTDAAQGVPATGGIADLLAEPASGPTVYRGVPPGTDPLVPQNGAGVTHWSSNEDYARSHGDLVTPYTPRDVTDLGDIREMFRRAGVDPRMAGNPGSLMEVLRALQAQDPQLSGWAKFRYPLEGAPEEYIHFGPLPPGQ